MPTGTPKPATREQLARFGHSAAVLRELMREKGWKSAEDINKAMGWRKYNAAPYQWVAAKAGPSEPRRAELQKTLKLDPKLLEPVGRPSKNAKRTAEREAARKARAARDRAGANGQAAEVAAEAAHAATREAVQAQARPWELAAPRTVPEPAKAKVAATPMMKLTVMSDGTMEVEVAGIRFHHSG